jgi:branched-chain amino acid transport system substrate-binding protein
MRGSNNGKQSEGGIMTRTVSLLGAALAAACVALAGAPSANAADDLVIGEIGSLTGPAASFDKSVVDGVGAWIKDWNNRGGFKGRTVKIELLDDGSSAVDAVTVYRKLTQDPKIDVVIGASPSASLLAMKAVSDEFGVPTVGVATVRQLGKPPAKFFFRALPSTDDYMKGLVDWLKAHNYHSLAILNPNTATGQSEAGLLKALAPAAGIKLVAAETYADTDTNFTAQLVNIRNAKPDFLYAGIIGGPSVTIFKQIKQLRLTMPIAIHSSAFNPAFYAGIGGIAQAEGIYTPIERGALASSASGVTLDLFKRASALLGHPATNLNTAGWDAAMLVEHAIETSDGTRNGIRDAIERTKDLPVIGGMMSYSPGDHSGKNDRSIGIGQLVKGKIVEAK